MGKVEDCFGSEEEGQAFALMSFEHPILRLNVKFNKHEGTNEQGWQFVAQANAGIVSEALLREPAADTIPDPTIAVQPFSSAYLDAYYDNVQAREDLSDQYVTTRFERNHLRIQSPYRDEYDMPTNVSGLFCQSDGRSLTLARAPLILEALTELDRLVQAKHDEADVLGRLARLALSNLWSPIN